MAQRFNVHPSLVVGRGANWPRPEQFWNALINAFHRTWPTRQDWEGAAHTKTVRDNRRHASSDRFGSLKSVGPFPLRGKSSRGELYFPRPADLGMRLVSGEGTNLPTPLRYAFLSRKKGKSEERVSPWIGATQYRDYLAGKPCAPDAESKAVALYETEPRMGIGIVVGAATYLVVDWAIDTAYNNMKCARISADEFSRLLPDGARGVSLMRIYEGRANKPVPIW